MSRTFLLSGLIFFFSLQLSAQNFQNAGEYMSYITKANDALAEKYISYLSGVSHGKSARKVEKRRQEVITAIYETRATVQGMPAFQGDKTLRDSTVSYYKILNIVFNEDYGKIVNMEEIAEQSYDLMEAYLLAQQKANEKLEQASKTQHEMQKQFAARHNVTLIDEQRTLDDKIKTVDAVMNHYDEVYLIFFKPYKQDAYLTDAMNRKDIAAIEQNNNSLKKFAEEGIEKLKSVKAYNNDPTLVVACRAALNFYKSEAGNGAVATDYFMKEEDFAKIKKTFDAKSGTKKTQQDIDQYNKAVNDMNAAIKKFNANTSTLNSKRTHILNDWNDAVKSFMDNYMPTRR